MYIQCMDNGDPDWMHVYLRCHVMYCNAMGWNGSCVRSFSRPAGRGRGSARKFVSFGPDSLQLGLKIPYLVTGWLQSSGAYVYMYTWFHNCFILYIVNHWCNKKLQQSKIQVDVKCGSFVSP